ncbi:MAG: RICIN domain-containing protein [Oscillospiraceae bacterium]|nr:RICIN domain-containing protein [Oscillospiraceae bacterium]
MKSPFKRLLCIFISIMCLMGFLGNYDGVFNSQTALAAAYDEYPISLVHIGTYDAASNIAASGTSIVTETAGSDASQSWYFEYVGSDTNGNYFRIINASNGKAITVSGTPGAAVDCVLSAASDSSSQLWYASSVQNDALGFGLYYKITSRADTNYVLANYSGSVKLSTYSGNSSQKWLLNTAGLQGFAGYAKTMDGQIKACNIGGLLGEVVMVDTFDELKQYATSDTPYTIVVTANISVTSLTMDSSGRYYCPDGRIYVHSNKTIIGSYAKHTLYNVQFCTSSSKGTGDNVIIRNFELQHDSESNGNDSIVVYFGSGYNLWVDHCTFTGHSDYNTASTGLEDWDKFLACCYDADYCTVSDCSFGLHEYGLILGYPADDESSYNNYNNFPCMSIIGNHFDETLTRAPGLMRYGYFHSLNNYVNEFSMAYTVHTACKIYAENCYYENGGNVICDWNTVTYPGSYAESGSTFVSCNRTTIQGYAQNCSWRPTTNYSYESISGADTKAYTATNSGAKSSSDQMVYISLDHDLSMEVSAESYAELDTSMLYKFKNANSGMYLAVEDGTATDGSNVLQSSFSVNTLNKDNSLWSLKDAGDGYYKLYSQTGDGNTYLLDLYYGSADNGTNIGIWGDTACDAQSFKFVDNGDGTYIITTKVTADASCLGVVSDSTDEGANVVQWERNGKTAQTWIIEAVHPIIDGEIIQRLERYDHTGADTIAIESNLAIGSLVFGDRTFTYTSLPDELIGAEFIKTACDSKAVEASTLVCMFDAAKDCTVYVAIDSRVETTPSWLSDWTLTDMTVVSSNDVTFNVYSLEVAAGESVALGGNGQSKSCINYTVMAMEKVEDAIIWGDANGDGIVNSIDATIVTRASLQVITLSESAKICCDVNNDGIINSIDATIITRFSLKIITTLPVS